MIFYRILKKGKHFNILVFDLIVFMCIAMLDIKIVEYSQLLIDATVQNSFNIYSYLIYLLPCLYTLYLVLDFLEYTLYVSYSKKAFLNLAFYYLKSTLLSPIHYQNNYSVDNLISRFTEDLSGISSKIITFITVFFYNSLFLILGFIYLFSIQAYLALMVLLLAIITTVVQRLADSKLPLLYKQVVATKANTRKLVVNSYKNLKTIKFNNAYDLLINKQKLALTNEYDCYYKYELKKSMYEWIIYFLKKSVILALYLIGSLYIHHKRISIGEFIAFILLINRLISKMDSLFKQLLNLNSLKVSLNRTDDIFKLRHEKLSESGGFKKKSVTIEFKNVCFSYMDHIVLNNVSFRITQGQKIAIVGSSGSGKSTILKLLLRLHEIDSGEIYLNSIESKEYGLADWRSYFSFVLQDCQLFTATIKNNITLFKQDQEEVIYKAVKNSGLSKPIEWLNSSYETTNSNLSGGEKQRLTLARALYRKSPVLLLDEFSANLDFKVEDEIINRVLNLVDTTVVSVTHRLRSMDMYDQIMVLNKGSIVEIGSFHQLLNHKGYFYNLYNSKEQDNE